MSSKIYVIVLHHDDISQNIYMAPRDLVSESVIKDLESAVNDKNICDRLFGKNTKAYETDEYYSHYETDYPRQEQDMLAYGYVARYVQERGAILMDKKPFYPWCHQIEGRKISGNNDIYVLED